MLFYKKIESKLQKKQVKHNKFYTTKNYTEPGKYPSALPFGCAVAQIYYAKHKIALIINIYSYTKIHIIAV